MDETRVDVQYLALNPYPTYSGSSMLFLDYYSDDYTNWEDNVTLWQYRTTQVTAFSLREYCWTLEVCSNDIAAGVPARFHV